MSTEVADAVVIGAGHNGLVAANLLADAGWDVLVLEANAEPGGAVRSGEVAAPGFTSDLFSSFYPLTAASPIMRALDLPAHGLRWAHAPHPLGHLLPDGRFALLSRDLDRTRDSVAAFAPGDAAAWTRLVEQWRDIREPLLDALFTPFPPVRAGLRLAGRAGVGRTTRLARLLTLPALRFAREEFAGEGARLLVAGNALHTDVDVNASGSAVFGWLLSMIGQDLGFPVPVGGSGRLTEALVRRFTNKGGRVVCGRAVREVLVARGRAVGVRDGEGDVVRARRAVVADVSAPVLYGELVNRDQLPARLFDDLRRFEWDSGTVKVDWALSGPIPWINAEAAGVGTLHLGVDLDGMAEYSADLGLRRVPARPFVLLGQLSAADPTRSPEGTETAWAYTHLPQGASPVGVAALLEDTVERHAPGFRELILGRHVQGPAELARQDANLAGGAIGGGTSAMHQQLVFRPLPGLGRADTPIDRLFLASASAHPGGAVHGGPGANAARAALRRAGLLGDVYAGIVGSALRAVYRDD